MAIHQPGGIRVRIVAALAVVAREKIFDVADSKLGCSDLTSMDRGVEEKCGFIGNLAEGRILVGDAQDPHIADILIRIADIVEFGQCGIGVIHCIQKTHDVAAVGIGIRHLIEIVEASIQRGAVAS
ncbi:MAG: hypothetical protein BWY63_03069 [Chloroflexi bacterium ADurb.Bin360]|nr:MAG: hypothetical protein BWY63_03069 [Chloroflexi bacterium ADurb.Bin360]